MEDRALARAAERERSDVAATWLAIKADLRKVGPFSKMILSFRESATEALADLVTTTTTDPAIRKLQDEVRRYMATIELIHGYREAAEAIDTNAEIEISDEQDDFLNTLEESE
jgi:hypothetical protein